MTSLERPNRGRAFSRHIIAQSVMARLIGDTGSQLFNPFLAIFAAGLKTSVITVGWLISLRSIVGLLAPVFGSIADRKGFQPVMCFGLACGSLGALLVGVSTHLGTATVGMILWGIGLTSFTPTLQAYLSSHLPYARRARGIAIVEYAWALAGIVGLFSMGWLIELVSWRAPFFVLSAGMALMIFVVARFPSPRPLRAAADASNPPAGNSWRNFFSLGANAASAYANIVAGGLTFFAAMQLFIAHGVWLTTEYGMRPVQLGTIALLLGLADLCGSVLVSVVTDGIGKRRSTIIGCCGALVGYLLLPVLNVSIFWAVVGIAVARGSFEFAIVSNISLISQQVPRQRGKVMTLGAAGGLIGATVAGTSGPWLYTYYGVMGISVVSAVFTALGILIYLAFVGDGATVHDEPEISDHESQ